jgi:hypothetical protein
MFLVSQKKIVALKVIYVLKIDQHTTFQGATLTGASFASITEI